YIRFRFTVPSPPTADRLSTVQTTTSAQAHFDSTTSSSQPIVLAAQEKKTVDEAKEFVQFMRDAWGLVTPELIISVTGGARFFQLTTLRTRTAFQKGLVAAATATSELRTLDLEHV
ncbi:unnamed protein product, partial [Didymodactylos carnosus]